MFDLILFFVAFGFFPEYGNVVDAKIVGKVLSYLESEADSHRREVEGLEWRYNSISGPLSLLFSVRRTLKLALQRQRKAELRLERACQLAARFGFQPVARYQYLARTTEDGYETVEAAQAV